MWKVNSNTQARLTPEPVSESSMQWYLPCNPADFHTCNPARSTTSPGASSSFPKHQVTGGSHAGSFCHQSPDQGLSAQADKRHLSGVFSWTGSPLATWLELPICPCSLPPLVLPAGLPGTAGREGVVRGSEPYQTLPCALP